MDQGRLISTDLRPGRDSFDAVIVPGGGLEPETCLPQPWVRARLDAALALNGHTRYFVVLSQGTTHRPPPIDVTGFPISEASASAKYLLCNGVTDATRILLDCWSLDTIGNAFFARSMICQPLKLEKFCVITSAFHMQRTRCIFDWIFGLDAWHITVDYTTTSDVGLSGAQLRARVQKEKASVDALENIVIPRHDSMQKVAAFVLQDHAAYRSESAARFDFQSRTDGHRQEDTNCDVKSTY